MKKIFLVIAIAGSSAAFAQDVQKPVMKPDTDKPGYYLIDPTQPQVTKDEQGQVFNLLPNGNKVIILPSDHMPCVVPDMSQYNMPVVKPIIPHTIPNPASPGPPARNYSPKPKVLTKEQFQKLIDSHRGPK